MIDPIYIYENLCSSIKAECSNSYVQQTFQKALAYFSHKQDINSINENKEQFLDTKSINEIHNSYKVFIQCLPLSIVLDAKMNQEEIRQLYCQTFEAKNIAVPEPILKRNRGNYLLWFGNDISEDDDETIFQAYFENDFGVFDCNENRNSVLSVKMISDTMLETDVTNYNNDNEDNSGLSIILPALDNQTNSKEQDNRLVNDFHSVKYIR